MPPILTLPDNIEDPLTVSALPSVVSPVTANVSDKEVAPVTASVPAIAVLPDEEATVNLLVFISKSPSIPVAPEISTSSLKVAPPFTLRGAAIVVDSFTVN